MDGLRLRVMEAGDWTEVGELIHFSTNHWYQTQGRAGVFTGDPTECELFCRVYESLDPGCCLVVENTRTGRIVGSCFYHPRPTHISIGIVNVHPAYFGKGVGRRMIAAVAEKADEAGKPLRLVSSAMNLDSFSLYTRAGFVPRQMFQDMVLTVPIDGLPGGSDSAVRPVTPEDIPAMVALEREVSGIEREKDYHYFLQNAEGIWKVLVLPGADGTVDGFLVSGTMIGPGVARTEAAAETLLRAMLDRHRGQTPLFLVPAECGSLVASLYALGAKNIELHVAQVRGAWSPPHGVVIPSFMPETG
jgi:ribosomal protein S18 acetylase RimI-like enzyme